MNRFHHRVMAALAMACTLSAASCGSKEEKEPERDPVRASRFVYSFSAGEELFSIADITIDVIGTDGVEEHETMSSSGWSRTFTADRFDVSSGVKIGMKLKSGMELTNETYRMEYAFSCSAVSTEDEAVVNSVSMPVTSSMSIRASMVEEYLSGRSIRAGLKIDAAGGISETELSWQGE